MAKHKSKLLKDSKSAQRTIEKMAEEIGGGRPKEVSKETMRRVEKAAEIANERMEHRRRCSSIDVEALNIKYFSTFKAE